MLTLFLDEQSRKYLEKRKQVIKHLKEKDIKEQEFSEQTLKEIHYKFNTTSSKRGK